MSIDTKIEWCDASLSPWIGCTKVSEGCAHCYAEARDRRHLNEPVSHWGAGAPRWRVKTFAAAARALDRRAQREGRRLRVFPSLCDPWDPEVPAAWVRDFLATVLATPHLDWLLLTKRPEHFFERLEAALAVDGQGWSIRDRFGSLIEAWIEGEPLPNVWIGASVENQRWADERVPPLVAIPARVRFLSMEPLLWEIDALPHLMYRSERTRIDWVIVGGESGPQARPCATQWVDAIVRQCRTAGVACYVKQLGSRFGGRDPKGGDPLEWPEWLNVRQFPEVRP